MHEASWLLVKWLRLSWSRKDFLTACGSVLVGTISFVFSRLVSSCVVLLGPLGGRSESSLGSLGRLLGSNLGPPGASPAASGPLVRSWAAPGRSGAVPGPLLGAPGPALAALRPFLGRSWAAPGLSWPALGASWASLGASWAALGSEEQIFAKTLIRPAFYGSDLACRGPKLALSWPKVAPSWAQVGPSCRQIGPSAALGPS